MVVTLKCISKKEEVSITTICFSDTIFEREHAALSIQMSHSDAADYSVGKLYDLTLVETPPRKK